MSVGEKKKNKNTSYTTTVNDRKIRSVRSIISWAARKNRGATEFRRVDGCDLRNIQFGVSPY